jgi:pantetheine-phosphate adenylyltransferase
MSSINYTFLSSSAVKELALNGGDIKGLVPDCIIDKINQKLSIRT